MGSSNFDSSIRGTSDRHVMSASGDSAPLSDLINDLGDGSAIGKRHTDAGSHLSSQTDPHDFQAVTVEHLGDRQARLILIHATRADLEALPDVWVQGDVMVRRESGQFVALVIS